MKKLFSPVLIALMLCASASAQTKSITSLNDVSVAGTNTAADKFSFEDVTRYAQKDSLVSENKPLETYSPSAGTIIGEVLLGPISGGIMGGTGALLISAIINQNGNGGVGNLGTAILVAGGGYVIGTGLGVYLFAHHDNPEVTFVGTLLGSVLGTGVGIGAAALINNGRSSVPYIVGFSCPLIGSMIYANFVAPHPKTTAYSSNTENYRSLALSYSHKDLYNNTLQYRMNLFTIAF